MRTYSGSSDAIWHFVICECKAEYLFSKFVLNSGEEYILKENKI